MGRAMLIICSAVLVSMGFIGIGSSNQGKRLNEKVVNYADFTIAKNAAHTGIQVAMQKTNSDDNWPTYHNSADNAWITNIQGTEVALYMDYDQGVEYWDPDFLRLYSHAEHYGNVIQVISYFDKSPFSTLVPEFAGALQLPTDVGTFTVDGAAHQINGISADPACTEDKPPIAVASDSTKQKLENEDLQKDSGGFEDGDIEVDTTLSYEPTDELIARLRNSNNATTVTSDYSGTLGTADNPGVFFMEGNVTLTGQQSEGFGIMVIQNNAFMDYQDPDNPDNSLDIRGNFEFNGLVIFENAFSFSGKGTPTINGSVLIGETADYTGDPIDITLAGDIEINYECSGENYAKQAAADAVEQNKYTRLVTRETIRYVADASDDDTLIDLIKKIN